MIHPKIKAILDTFVVKPPVELGPEARSQSSAHDLSKQLWAANKSARTLQFIAAAMILILFILTIIGLSIKEIGSVSFSAVAAASGVTLSGLIIMMLRSAHLIHESAVLAALAERLPPEDVRDVMLAILNRKAPFVDKAA